MPRAQSEKTTLQEEVTVTTVESQNDLTQFVLPLDSETTPLLSTGFVGNEYPISSEGRLRLKERARTIVGRISQPQIKNHIDYLDNTHVTNLQHIIAYGGFITAVYRDTEFPAQLITGPRKGRNEFLQRFSLIEQKQLAQSGNIWEEPNGDVVSYILTDDIDAEVIDGALTEPMLARGNMGIFVRFLDILTSAIQKEVQKINAPYFNYHEGDLLTGQELFIIAMARKHHMLEQSGRNILPAA